MTKNKRNPSFRQGKYQEKKKREEKNTASKGIGPKARYSMSLF